MPTINRTFSALQHRHYRLLWLGSMLATTAFMTSFMRVPAVAYDITGRNASAGLAQMGQRVELCSDDWRDDLFELPPGGPRG